MDHWHYFEQPDGRLTELLDGWQRKHPEGGFVAYVAESNCEFVGILQKECGRRDMLLAGGVFPRLIVRSGIMDTGLLLYAHSTMPAFTLISSLHDDSSCQKMTEELGGLVGAERDRLLMMYFDNSLPDIATRVEECHLQFADQVAYAGATAGSERFEQVPCLFDRDRFEPNSMLAMLLPYRDGPYMEHGFSLPKTLLPVTSSAGNCIETINWRPAFDVYRELAMAEYQTEISRENFYRLGVRFPVGIVRSDSVMVRIPVSLTDDNCLFCCAEIPEYSLLTLLESNEADLMQGIIRLSDAINDAGCNYGLTFYCAGRGLYLGRDGTLKEIERLARQIGDVYGVFSLGEIGSYRNEGYPALQNTSIVFCPHRYDE